MVVYCLDAQFASDGPKFVAGALQALSAMVQLELPHINVLTKVDLLAEDSKVRTLVQHQMWSCVCSRYGGVQEELQAWNTPQGYTVHCHCR